MAAAPVPVTLDDNAGAMVGLWGAGSFAALTGPLRSVVAASRLRAPGPGGGPPIIEIAGRVGCDDPSQLARVFRKHLGTSPGRYRRERKC